MGQAEGEGQGEGLNAWFGWFRGILENASKEIVLPHAHWQRFTLRADEENQLFKLLLAQRVLPRGFILQTLRVALGRPTARSKPRLAVERVQSPPDRVTATVEESESEVSRDALDYFASELELILGNPREVPKLIAALTWPGLAWQCGTARRVAGPYADVWGARTASR